MPRTHEQNRTAEVFLAFLRLGCTSFGGPVAHLGYFERELIERRGWTSRETYAELVALAQALPGPASSQVGFALGLLRAGTAGGLAAFVAFTLPSALLMLAFAALSASGSAVLNGPAFQRALHGLELVAVAVVAQAVMAMRRTLAPDARRMVLAVLTAALVLALPGPWTTLLAIALGCAAGLIFYRDNAKSTGATVERGGAVILARAASAALLVFALLFLAAFLLPRTHNLAGLAATFYRSGALVFGGGHVVLPLLETTVVAPGWATQPQFLAGYGAAQAMPGPLFSFAAYLGAVAVPLHPVMGGVLALLGLFAPGLLLMFAAIPFWAALRTQPALMAGLRGVNAAVVGVLAAALIRPLGTTAIRSVPDAVVAVAAFALLTYRKVAPWIVVVTVATLYGLSAIL